MKTRVYYATDIYDLILVRTYEDGFDYIADATTTGTISLIHAEIYDKELELFFAFNSLPIAFHKNLVFIGYL